MGRPIIDNRSLVRKYPEPIKICFWNIGSRSGSPRSVLDFSPRGSQFAMRLPTQEITQIMQLQKTGYKLNHDQYSG